MSVETIEHTGTGAEFEVHEHGANIMSFKPVLPGDGGGDVAGGGGGEDDPDREVLFVSRESKSLPIVGGIPIQFPIVVPFGDKQEMPEGGFLQHNNWHMDEAYKYDAKSDAAVQYSLEFDHVTNARGHGLWAAAEPGAVSYKADCVYNIKVKGPELSAALTIKNSSSSRANTFPFQLLFHNYFRVLHEAALNPEECYVKGLEGYIRQDKVADTGEMIEQPADPVVLNPDGETHYIFDPKGHMTKDLNVLIATAGGRVIQLKASCKIDDTEIPVTCVVWNPHRSKAVKLHDFGSAEYNDMIGVQPGILERQMLQPQQTCVFEWSIKVLSEDGSEEDWKRDEEAANKAE